MFSISAVADAQGSGTGETIIGTVTDARRDDVARVWPLAHGGSVRHSDFDFGRCGQGFAGGDADQVFLPDGIVHLEFQA